MSPSISNNQGQFISSWTLKNFKSVKSAKVDLSPLTIVVGKNSSGKSSLIQSILLLSQNNSRSRMTTAIEDPEGKLDLNGVLVNLGTFAEVVNDSADRREIEIGGTLRMGKQEEDTNRRALSVNRTLDSLFPESEKEISWQMTLRSQQKREQQNSGFAKVKKSSIEVSLDQREIQKIEATDVFSPNPESEQFFPDFDFSSTGRVKTYDPEYFRNRFKSESRTELKKSIRLAAIRYSGGLPASGLLEEMTRLDLFIHRHFLAYWSEDRLRSRLIRHRSASRSSTRYEREIYSKELQQKALVQEEVLKKISLKGNEDPNSRDYIERLKKEIEVLKQRNELLEKESTSFESQNVAALEQISAGYIEQILSLFSSEVNDPWNREDWGEFPEPPFESIFKYVSEDPNRGNLELLRSIWLRVQDTVKERLSESKIANEVALIEPEELSRRAGMTRVSEDYFLTSTALRDLQRQLQMVTYLGPLRENPRHLYERDISLISPSIPIGKKGELLARRLHEVLRGDYPLPEGRSSAGKRSFGLRHAVNEWLVYLGLAESKGVSVSIEGASGFRLKVDNRGLPEVGTGVSQVLPVIALCLLAPKGGTILLEEPELHLNPGMQQKLADFFLAIAKSGRQIIAETHSEYVVTRLRRRAAEDTVAADLLAFLFTEHDSHNGTTYRNISPGDNGLVLEWPQGFFDQVSEDVKQILLKTVTAKSLKP